MTKEKGRKQMLKVIQTMLENPCFWYGFIAGAFFTNISNLMYALQCMILDYGWRKRKEDK